MRTKLDLLRLKQKMGETRMQILSLRQQQKKEVLDELRDTQEKLAEELEKEKAAADTFRRTFIVAPQAGIVHDLKVFTQGGVIRAGEAIMEVVPDKVKLIIQAQVNPNDIDVVHKGLEAQVRLTALKARTTPTLTGRVIHVSADALVDRQTKASYFEALVAINPGQLKRLRNVKLYPGMPVEVLIISHKITPWDYFVAPIKSSMQRAFRED